jgi:hypothetical protein
VKGDKEAPLVALALGLPKGKGKSEGGDADSEYDDDFESAAVDAFPELEGSPERIEAFKQAVMACMDRHSQKGSKGEA